MKVSQLPESESNPLPDDQYNLVVEKIEKKVGKKSGKSYLSIEYKVTDGTYKGRKVWDNISLSNESVWMLGKWLRALDQESLELPITQGADGAYEVDEDGCYEAIAESVKNQTCTAEVATRPEDKEKGYPAKNEIKFYHKTVSFTDKGSTWDE